MLSKSTTDILRQALDGDQDAWRCLVDRYGPMIWRVARAHRLRKHDAADISQTTWAALAQHGRRIHSPERLATWLTTTARRECARLIDRGHREIPAGWRNWDDLPDGKDGPEVIALRGERDTLLWRAFTALPGRCQQLLGLLAFAPELSYPQLARAVGLADTSVGRSRTRCLDILRRKITILGVPNGAVG
ncbi:RNA polymerase sigma factor [Actinokineospora enzanensis]|uniref:RNA polymerase sigma factor n=1 Tax=Actinokineospora enzanensis TaxID=155975 RepID=UPI00036FC0AA|nr:sigma-70 family RNA polymerase sigma factor [Actinokineospora enzanensis]